MAVFWPAALPYPDFEVVNCYFLYMLYLIGALVKLCSGRNVLFPFFNLKYSVINLPAIFPFHRLKQPEIGIESLNIDRGRPVSNWEMEKNPWNDIQQNRFRIWKKNYLHDNFISPERSWPNSPFNLSFSLNKYIYIKNPLLIESFYDKLYRKMPSRFILTLLIVLC